MSDRSVSAKPGEHENEWNRWERRSTRIALAIALVPIPLALAISWSLGSPPWKERPAPTFDEHQETISPEGDGSPLHHR